jgi:RNA polymerase sigma factor (sigma-70 family)
MTHRQLGTVLQHLCSAAARKKEDELSDGQLLKRFTQQRDESAFAALLRRHGPMVLGVCSGILRRLHDVEDAFQATFLILAQKAPRIHRGESLGGWLHEVAYNVALKAQTRAARCQGCAGRMPNIVEADPLDDLTVRELRRALHEELQQLPDKYRAPLLLCYFEGNTQEEAARKLGWPHRRVKDRLQRGREQLRRRLHKRGLAPAVALGTALFAADGVTAAVPVMLAGMTLRTAMQGAHVPPTVAALVKAGEVLASASKAKTATGLLLVVNLLIVATSGTLVGWYMNASEPPAVAPPSSAAKPDEKAKAASPRPEAAKAMEIQGRVFGTDGKPKAGAKLILLDKKGHTHQLGTTAADGRFTVKVKKEVASDWDHWLIAQDGGAGIRFLNLYQWKAEKPVELRLVKDHVIRGRVVTTEGMPVADVRVVAEEIESFANNSLDDFLAGWKNNQLDFGSEQNIWSGASALFTTTTDAEGRFALAGIGGERTVNLHLLGGGIAVTSVRVVNRAGFDPKPYNQAFLDRIKGMRIRHGNWRWFMLSGPDVSVVAQPEKILRGTVRDIDTGKGVPDALVRLLEDSEESVQFPPESRTDAQGHYELHGIRKTKRYLLVAFDEAVRGYVNSQVWVDDTAGYQPITADLRVKKGVIITGKVIDRGTGKPIGGFAWPAVLAGNPFVKDYPQFRESLGLWSNLVSSDADGTFRVATIPGPVVLMGGPSDNPSPVYKPPQPDPKYPQYFSVRDPRHPRDFSITVHPAIGGANGGIPQGNFCKVLEIQPGVTLVKQDIVLERATVRTVTIRDAEGLPLAGTWAAGLAPSEHHPAQRISETSCSVYGGREEPKLLVFYHPEKKLAGTRRLKGDEKEPISVRLGPTGAIKGRLLDDNGKPQAGITIEVKYRDREAEEVHSVSHGNKPIVTDANGAFTFDEVIPGSKFDLSFRRGAQRYARESKPGGTAVAVQPGQCRELGSIQLKRVPEQAGE